MEASEVWYTSETRLRSRAKLIVHDDVGRLRVDGDEVTFVGTSTNFRLCAIGSARLINQSWPLVSYAWVLVIDAVLLAVVFMFLRAVGQPQMIWWPLASVVAMVPFAYAVGRATKWIEIEGTLESGERVRCYFADGTNMGWSGMFGGTRRLLDRVRHA